MTGRVPPEATGRSQGGDRRAVCIGECMVELRRTGPNAFNLDFSGDVYNTAVYLKRSAAELDVQLATVTGTDSLSQTMRAEWGRYGVGDALAASDPQRTAGLYMIETDALGERRFQYWRGESAARRWPAALAAAADAGALDGVGLIYLSGISLAILTPEDRSLALEVLTALRGRVGRIAYDPNLRPTLWGELGPARAALGIMAELADILLPSEQDLELLLDEVDIETMAERLLGMGAAEFAITAQARGCLLCADGRSLWMNAPRVDRVVDTTGAGDSFNGAYLGRRLTGAFAAEAAAAGMALAAYVVTQPGAITAPPSLPQSLSV